ncbi:hypothetical protein COCON_G00098190 [Conger conger]|uniref:AB hydrolase-1 domain-containing protein n=1 Tax=Conger conger TaxID=82655 RepID=A0A9Q1HZS7_CONCO|nr:hypothetical protein COCON_G00098190 [Conger conger]
MFQWNQPQSNIDLAMWESRLRIRGHLPLDPGPRLLRGPPQERFQLCVCRPSVPQADEEAGLPQFYAHGGDWGWLITTNMAQLQPKTVKGLHVNFAPAQGKPGARVVLSLLLGRCFPKLFGFTQHDVEGLFPIRQKVLLEMLLESGYMHIQATKPDTVGRGLNDSPVGLATYILEKFSTWTNKEFRNLENGGLERNFSLDDLLTNVMIYWTTGSIISSMRFYKENIGGGFTQKHALMAVYVPTGFASFPNELIHTPKLWAKQKYPKLKTHTVMPRGGHFAAMEEPQLMAEDIQNFVRDGGHAIPKPLVLPRDTRCSLRQLLWQGPLRGREGGEIRPA